MRGIEGRALALLLDNADRIERLAQLKVEGRIDDAEVVVELARIVNQSRLYAAHVQELPSVELDLVDVEEPLIDFSLPPWLERG